MTLGVCSGIKSFFSLRGDQQKPASPGLLRVQKGRRTILVVCKGCLLFSKALPLHFSPTYRVSFGSKVVLEAYPEVPNTASQR